MPGKRALHRADVEDALRQLQGVLTAVERGELDAKAQTRHRLEGAAIALSVVLGEPHTPKLESWPARGDTPISGPFPFQ